MYDYPGLSSDEMLAARRALPMADNLADEASYADLIPYLHPDWLVLRPREIDLINAKNPAVLAGMYHAERTFDVTPELDPLRLPDKPLLLHDSRFVVFHRS